MSEVAHTLGRKLRDLRSARGLSQEELAERAGLSVNAVGAFERGERFPRAKSLDRILDVLQAGTGPFLDEVFMAAEASGAAYGPKTRVKAFKDLIFFLSGRSERFLRLMLDVAKRVAGEVESEAETDRPQDI
jgi:transcriptional regulator with XRE-family HTH domain